MNRKKVYRSLIEIEKDFFPISFKEKKDKKVIGTGLTIKLLEDVIKELNSI